VPESAKVVAQGEIVARSLDDYLHRHPEMAVRCTTGGNCRYLTTENPDKFGDMASLFLGEEIDANHIDL
jgi:glutamate racemase